MLQHLNAISFFFFTYIVYFNLDLSILKNAIHFGQVGALMDINNVFRILFMIFTGLHALMHLMGFAKAFNLAKLEEMRMPVSKLMGILWLIACLSLLFVVLNLIVDHSDWIIAAFVGIFLSQILVIKYWRDAKFGTIPNIIILIVAVISLLLFNFNRGLEDDFKSVYVNPGKGWEPYKLTEEKLESLSIPVQRWLNNTNVVGDLTLHSVSLNQKLQLKIKPDDKDWTDATAIQYINMVKPSFIWILNMKTMYFIDVIGRDKLVDGKGSMLISILGIYPIVDIHDNDKINTASMQRYLGEIVWIPSAAIRPFISWEEIDDYSAKATLTFDDITVHGTFHFDENGDFISFKTTRYLGADDNAQLREWVITSHESREINGLRIPSKLEATWRLDDGDWTWLKLEITDIAFNRHRMPFER